MVLRAFSIPLIVHQCLTFIKFVQNVSLKFTRANTYHILDVSI